MRFSHASDRRGLVLCEQPMPQLTSHAHASHHATEAAHMLAQPFHMHQNQQHGGHPVGHLPSPHQCQDTLSDACQTWLSLHDFLSLALPHHSSVNLLPSAFSNLCPLMQVPNMNMPAPLKSFATEQRYECQAMVMKIMPVQTVPIIDLLSYIAHS